MLDRQSMYETPLVSVIIPTYNRRNTIGRAIDSVLHQTYKNIEIIVVDDGSVDDTKEFISSRYLSEGSVPVFYTVNKGKKGAAGARNFGVESANGEYIAFQDSDDDWEDALKLDKQMDILLSNKEISLVYCGVAYYFQDDFVDFFPARDLSSEEKEGDLFQRLLMGSMIGPPTVVMRRGVFVQLGGFCEDCRALEDHEFFIRVAKKCRIGFAEKTYVKAYCSEGSLSECVEDIIRTKVYILEKWFDEYVSFHLLNKRIYSIMREADEYGYRKLAVLELKKIKQIAASEELCRLVDNMLEDDESIANRTKIQAEKDIVDYDGIIPILAEKFQKKILVWEDVKSDLYDILSCLKEYAQLYDLAELQDKVVQFIDSIDNVCSKREKLNLIRDIQVAWDALSEYLSKSRFICNVCKNEVFFCRTSQGATADNKCPICKFYGRERLVIAFLDLFQTENVGKIKMLQVGMHSMQRYAKMRSDVLWCRFLALSDIVFEAETLNVENTDDETYDVIVCSGIPKKGKDNTPVLRELRRLLKKDGVCVFTAADYGKEFIVCLRDAEFHVSELGKEWFGKDIYQAHGFDEMDVLCVATRNLELP